VLFLCKYINAKLKYGFGDGKIKVLARLLQYFPSSSHGGSRFVIAFDPSYINKSGKKTPGLGWYWSGCAGQAKWGLEIGGLAAIDLDNHTAFPL
jgi:hypothetical protein